MTVTGTREGNSLFAFGNKKTKPVFLIEDESRKESE